MATVFCYNLREKSLELRGALGISQQELGSMLKVAHTTIVKWESKKKPCVRTFSVYLEGFKRLYKSTLKKDPDLIVKSSVVIGRKSVGSR